MRAKTFIVILAILFSGSNVLARQTPPRDDPPAGELSLKLGYGRHAVNDRFISRAKYSGTSPMFAFDWRRSRHDGGFRLGFELVNSATLRNFAVSAELTTADLSTALLYAAGEKSLLGRPLQIFLGPAPEISFYYRRQNLARGGAAVFDTYSVAAMLSLGVHLAARYPLKGNLRLDAFVQSNLISLGGKFLDPRDSDDSPVKILLFSKALNFKLDWCMTLRLTGWAAAKAGYGFRLLRVTAWDPLTSARDELFLTLSIVL